jgi:hypothetical protein
MIPRSNVFPGITLKIIKTERGTLKRRCSFWPMGYFTSPIPFPVSLGEEFMVLEHPRTVDNVTLVRVKRLNGGTEGDMRYGELHFHCELVDPPKGRTLWERIEEGDLV